MGGSSSRVARGVRRRGWEAHFSVLLVTCPSVAAQARAADDDASEPFVEIHGFVSQGAFKTSGNKYLVRDSEQGSLEFSEAGINFTETRGQELRVGIQLFARGLGPIGDYKPQLDWYYLDYRTTDWLGLRAGRLKLPLGLYDDTIDIDSARVPVLLPQSLYPTRSRDYFLAQTGGELYGLVALGDAGALDYRAYGGTIFIDVPSYSTAGSTSVSIPYLFGGRLLWQTPLEGLQAAVSAQRLRFDIHYTPSGDVLATYPMPLPSDFEGKVELSAVTLFVASAEYAVDDLLLRRSTSANGSDSRARCLRCTPSRKPRSRAST